MGCVLELIGGLLDGISVVLFSRFFDLVDGGLNGGFVAIGNLFGVFLEQLFHLPDHLIGRIASIDQVAFSAVFLGVRLGFMLHAIYFPLAEGAAAFDANFLLLARGQGLGR